MDSIVFLAAMSFLYPGFLFALAFLAIPIIIHLFNFRRYKKVYFTNVKFLKEIKEETSSRSKLKHLLILASRLLALAFLVFAFAQPFIPVDDSEVTVGEKAVSIYVDNSFSMMASSEELPLFEQARQKAREIASAYSTSDRFHLATNDFKGKHQRLLSREEFLAELDEVEISPATRNLSAVVKQQRQAMQHYEFGQRLAYLVSDFQRNVVDLQEDTTMQVNLVHLQSVTQNNLFIDSTWLESPVLMMNQPNRLFVRLKNSGTQPVEESQLNLTVNGQVKALSNFNIGANDETVDTLVFSLTEPGWHQGVLSVNDHPVTFDDSYYISFRVAENNRVLVIHEERENPYLNAFFKDHDYFLLTNRSAGQIDYSSLPGYNIIILSNLKSIPSGLANELQQFISNGGSVAVFPSMAADQDSYNSFLGSLSAAQIQGIETQDNQLSRINVEQEIFKNVFEDIPNNLSLPRVKSRFLLSRRSQALEEPLLTFRDGSSFLNAYSYENGTLFLFSTPLDIEYTDLPVHAIFVPMVYKMAVNAQRAGNLQYTLGQDNVIEVEAEEMAQGATMRLVRGDSEMIPPQRMRGNRVVLNLGEHLNEAGIYNLRESDNAAPHLIALNYSRKESELSTYSEADLQSEFSSEYIKVIRGGGADLTTVINQLNKGVALWKLCVILALIFLAVEVLLLRFWRV